MKKVYIGCALTQAPKEFLDFIFGLREKIKTLGFEILEFAWITGPREDVNVYDFDVKNVDGADYFFAFCDYPSIGLGIEIERAMNTKTPTFAFHKKGTNISKIVSDSLISNGMNKPFEYESEEDVLNIIKKEILQI